MSFENQTITLQEYKVQRQYRDAKRKEYLRRFEIIRQKMNLASSQKIGQESKENKLVKDLKDDHKQHHQPNKVQIHQNNEDQTQLQLIKENQSLRKELITLQTQEREKLQKFKNQVGLIKGKYIQQIKQLTDLAKKSKQQNQVKLQKIETQILVAIKKNQQIQAVNNQLQKQINQSQTMIEKYSQQIKLQYKTKLEQFQKIFNASNQKIEAMEKEFNEDEFIETTLKNEELMKTIQQSCLKSQQPNTIIADYQTLLQGKQQILQQIGKNNEIKESEIKKMIELQEKLKAIFDKLNEEKKVYLAENNKMAQDLMEIKTLLTGGMNQE